jgi:hypothetical protein
MFAPRSRGAAIGDLTAGGPAFDAPSRMNTLANDVKDRTGAIPISLWLPATRMTVPEPAFP